MTVYSLKLFGLFPLLVVTRTNYEIVEEESPAIGGGSTHNFEMATPFVDERYLPWEDEDLHFGFK